MIWVTSRLEDQQSEEQIGERVRAGSTITTSTRGPNGWYPLFPNPVLAEGILDRLLNSAHQIFMSTYVRHQGRVAAKTRDSWGDALRSLAAAGCARRSCSPVTVPAITESTPLNG